MKPIGTFATCLGLAMLASCAAGKSPDNAAMNGAESAEQVQYDAAMRAEHLSEQAQILNTESRMANGTQRKQLAGEASQDEAAAGAIVRDANEAASTVATGSKPGGPEASPAR